MTQTTVQSQKFKVSFVQPVPDEAAVQAVLAEFEGKPLTFTTQVDIINALLPLFTPQDLTVDLVPEVAE